MHKYINFFSLFPPYTIGESCVRTSSERITWQDSRAFTALAGWAAGIPSQDLLSWRLLCSSGHGHTVEASMSSRLRAVPTSR